MDRVREELAHHNKQYYVEDSPEISDAEYDKLRREFERLHEDYTTLLKNEERERESARERDYERALQEYRNSEDEGYEEWKDEEIGPYEDLESREDLKWEKEVLESKWRASRAGKEELIKVGAPPREGLERVEHGEPMTSLSNAFTREEVRKEYLERMARFLGEVEESFVRGVRLVGELKYDGAALSLRYEGGRLKRAATRGDGRWGEDVTQNVRKLLRPPEEVGEKGMLEVRGEAYMTLADFEAYREERKRANEKRRERGVKERVVATSARNATAGSLRVLHWDEETLERPLRFVAHGWAGSGVPGSWEEALGILEGWGFETPLGWRAVEGEEGLAEFYGEWEKRGGDWGFDADGVVFKVDDMELRERLGVVGGRPRWGTAWKFAPEEALTRVEAIEVQVGRLGALTPVARLSAVRVGGVEVKNATLHNEDGIKEKDVRVGDMVWIRRAGGVIPEVVRVDEGILKGGVKRGASYEFPTRCPSCGARAERELMEDGNESAARRCTGGASCPAQVKERVKHYVSRGAMDIEGIGWETIEAMYEGGQVKSVADLYRLEERYGGAPPPEWGYEGGKRKGELRDEFRNLFRAIEMSKKRGMDRFLRALGIRRVGEETARLLSRRYGSWEALEADVGGISGRLGIFREKAREWREAVEAWRGLREAGDEAASKEAFARKNELAKEKEASAAELGELGVAVSVGLAEFFGEERNRELLRELFSSGVEPAAVDEEITGASVFAGKSLVFTGKMEKMGRREAQDLARKLGGRVQSGVTGGTDFVVAGEGGGVKLERAKELGVRVLSEEEWLETAGV